MFEVCWERIVGRLRVSFRSGWRGDGIFHLFQVWDVKCGISFPSMILDSVSDFGYLDIHKPYLSLSLDNIHWV